MRHTPLVPLLLASLMAAAALTVTACGGGADDSLDQEADTRTSAATSAGAGAFSLTLEKTGSTVAGGLAAAEIKPTTRARGASSSPTVPTAAWMCSTRPPSPISPCRPAWLRPSPSPRSAPPTAVYQVDVFGRRAAQR